MNRTKALAVVCLSLVLIGGSVSIAFGGSSQDATEIPKQIAVSTGDTGTVDVEIQSAEHHILQGQSDLFVVRIVSDNQDGIFLGFRSDVDAPTSFEFHNQDVRRLPKSGLFPQYDAVGYIPAAKIDDVEHVPVIVSSEGGFAAGSHTIYLDSSSGSSTVDDRAAFDLRVFCSVECRVTWLWQQPAQNPELTVAILSLLVAFFGRKRIWAALKVPKKRIMNVSGTEREE